MLMKMAFYRQLWFVYMYSYEHVTPHFETAFPIFDQMRQRIHLGIFLNRLCVN